jgi:hypothetical protein
MRFIDPWAIFQYLGGTFSTHLSLAIFGFNTYKRHKAEFEHLKDCTGFEKCPKLGIKQVQIMMMSHIFCMFTIMIRRILKNHPFVQEMVKIYNIFFY